MIIISCEKSWGLFSHDYCSGFHKFPPNGMNLVLIYNGSLWHSMVVYDISRKLVIPDLDSRKSQKNDAMKAFVSSQIHMVTNVDLKIEIGFLVKKKG